MNTTALLVEIVIVGFSFFLAMLPPVALIFGIDAGSIWMFYIGVPLHLQLAASFLTGIVWNRMSDQTFHLLDERFIKSKFLSRQAYQEARIRIISDSPSIKEYIGTIRSFIRVLRAFTITLLIYVISTPIYVFYTNWVPFLSVLGKLSIILFEILLLLSSYYAWRRLAKGYVSAIFDAYTFLKASGRMKDTPFLTGKDINK